MNIFSILRLSTYFFGFYTRSSEIFDGGLKLLTLAINANINCAVLLLPKRVFYSVINDWSNLLNVFLFIYGSSKLKLLID